MNQHDRAVRSLIDSEVEDVLISLKGKIDRGVNSLRAVPQAELTREHQLKPINQEYYRGQLIAYDRVRIFLNTLWAVEFGGDSTP